MHIPMLIHICICMILVNIITVNFQGFVFFITHSTLYFIAAAAAAAAAMGMSPLDPLLRAESSHPVLPPSPFQGPRGSLRPELFHPGGLLRPPFDDPNSNPCLMNPLMQQLRQQRF